MIKRRRRFCFLTVAARFRRLDAPCSALNYFDTLYGAGQRFTTALKGDALSLSKWYLRRTRGSPCAQPPFSFSF